MGNKRRRKASKLSEVSFSAAKAIFLCFLHSASKYDGDDFVLLQVLPDFDSLLISSISSDSNNFHVFHELPINNFRTRFYDFAQVFIFLIRCCELLLMKVCLSPTRHGV